jgi:CBS domain-containing protein
MRVREIMTPNVHIISDDSSLQEAAALMREQDIGILPVFRGNEVIGTITDRDITVQAVAGGWNPTKTRVSDAMTKNVFSCFEDDAIDVAVQLMKQHQIRRLLVTDKHKHPVGMISIGDLATRLHNDRITEDVVESVSEQRH